MSHLEKVAVCVPIVWTFLITGLLINLLLELLTVEVDGLLFSNGTDSIALVNRGHKPMLLFQIEIFSFIQTQMG